MPQEYFYTGKVDANGKPIYELPTYVSFGSPVSGKELDRLVGVNESGGLGYTYKGAFTKPNDGVGEILGGNNGANDGSVSLLYRLNPAVILYDSVLLLTPWSPHGSYKPTDYLELQDVTGYKE